jgi:HAMP domain-containing protein
VLLLPGAAPTIEGVSRVIELVIVILLPTAAGYAIIVGFRGARWSLERWQARQYRHNTPVEPIERLGVKLRRLRAELDATETRHDVPAKNLRVKALRGAYVDVLSAACERLDVPPPPGGDRAPLTEIYRVEAALRQRGLDVRQVAVR